MTTPNWPRLDCWACEAWEDFNVEFSPPPAVADQWANTPDADRQVCLYLAVWQKQGWQLVPRCGIAIKKYPPDPQAPNYELLHLRWHGPQWFCPRCVKQLKETASSELPEPEKVRVVVAMHAARAAREAAIPQNTFAGLRDYALIALAFGTGLHRSELVALDVMISGRHRRV